MDNFRLADQPGVIAFVAQFEAVAVEFELAEMGGCSHGTNWRPIFLISAWYRGSEWRKSKRGSFCTMMSQGARASRCTLRDTSHGFIFVAHVGIGLGILHG